MSKTHKEIKNLSFVVHFGKFSHLHVYCCESTIFLIFEAIFEELSLFYYYKEIISLKNCSKLQRDEIHSCKNIFLPNELRFPATHKIFFFSISSFIRVLCIP